MYGLATLAVVEYSLTKECLYITSRAANGNSDDGGEDTHCAQSGVNKTSCNDNVKTSSKHSTVVTDQSNDKKSVEEPNELGSGVLGSMRHSSRRFTTFLQVYACSKCAFPHLTLFRCTILVPNNTSLAGVSHNFVA